MKSTRLSFVMIMTLLFLLPTGCRKDDFNDQGETKKIQFASQNQKLAIYSPLFDTIPPNVGTRDKPEFKAISPKKKQLEEMVESFRQLNGSDPFIKDLITSIRSGYIPDFNYSTIHGKETDKGFIIFVPLIKNNKVDHVLRYTYSEGAFSFGLISRQKINQYIDSGTFESESLSHNFASINILNFYSFITSSDIDKKLNDAVVNLSKKVKKPKGGRCEQIIIMEWWGYGLISVNGTTQPGYATSGEFEIRIPCSAGGSNTTQTITTNTETSSVTTTGGGYTSPTSLTSTLNLAVKTVLPYINNDCLDKMDNFTKTTITGVAKTISGPCGDPESIKNLITQVVVTKCNNAPSTSSYDPFSFIAALTQFEFGQEVTASLNQALSAQLGFNSAFQQNLPTLSVTRRICPQFFTITPNSFHPDDQNVAGIKGLQISFTRPGATAMTLSFNHLVIKVDRTIDCSISSSSLIADALNSAIDIAQVRISTNNSIFPTVNQSISDNMKFVMLFEFQINQIASNRGCIGTSLTNGSYVYPNTQGFDAAVIPSSYAQSLGVNYHCGAQFVDFTNTNLSRCP